ncbi:hypothetical protein R1sor_020519 [Riccia sorocarpa]|uniref:Reverse transcriptase n=1 Tax=Riccia sorocarpa TaxID=122646 RepID=A0ABD3IFS9_9MARC
MADSSSAAASTSARVSTFAGEGGTGPAVGTAAGTPPGVVPTPTPTDMIGVLQALATLIRQQPAGERQSTKALQSFVHRMGRFSGREISRYLREYHNEMELVHASDPEMIAEFELVAEPELRDRIREIVRRYSVTTGGWSEFERAMREEYLEDDTERVTRRTFLDWIEQQPGRVMGLSELLREFERRYNQLPAREKLNLETRRTELFLRAADDVSTDRLCFMLADRMAEGGIATDWHRIDDAVSILTKQRRSVGVHYVVPPVPPRAAEPPVVFQPRAIPQVPLMAPPVAPAIQPVVQMPVAAPQQPAVRPAQVPAPVPVVAPAPRAQRQRGGQDQQNAIDELTRQLQDLRVEMARLQAPVPVAPVRPQYDGPRRCIWCDSLDHMRRECPELTAAVRDGIVHYQNDRLHLTATGEPLRTRYGRGGMRTMLPQPAAAGVAVAVPPGALADVQAANAALAAREADVFVGHVVSAGPVLSVDVGAGSLSTRSSGTVVPIEELRRGAESIRQSTGWDDLVEVNTIHAFLDAKKHVTWEDAIVEEKRRREEAGMDNGTEGIGHRVIKRRGGDIAGEAPSSRPPAPGPMEGVRSEAPTEKKTRGQKTPVQDKGKLPTFRLMSDIESMTDLKSVFEKGFLAARVEFTLGDLLGIAKKEYHDLIIDVLKRKRQAVPEKVADQTVCLIEDDVTAPGVCNVNATAAIDGTGEEFVALVAGSATAEADEEDEVIRPPSDSDYRKEFWARVTDEVKVQLGGLTEPVTALVDTGSEINIISRAVYERGQWPIDMHHGWALRSANGVKKPLYGACPNIPVRIGNVVVTQNFFVQDNTPTPVILGQPYITAVRMESKVLNDGSHFARIRSLDDRQSVQFLTVRANHERNRCSLRDGAAKAELKLQGWQSGVISCSVDSYSHFQRLEDLNKKKRVQLEKEVDMLQCTGVLTGMESVYGVYEERVCSQSVAGWCDVVQRRLKDTDENVVIPLHSRELYEHIAGFLQFLPHPELRCLGKDVECWCNFVHEAEVHTKYKSVMKKVKPVATQLPGDSQQHVELAAEDPYLRDMRQIGHRFTVETLAKLQIGRGDFLTKTEKLKFVDLIRSHQKAFAFSAEEIGCADPKVVAPMVIFTVPHVPWDLKPIPVPRALLPKLIALLKEKVRMGILEPSMAPYSSRWFTVPKKSGALRFIQDLQPANRVTIRNVGTGPVVDEIVDDFAGKAIYSIGDLFSGYDQFQLAVESRDLTTIRTPLGLMRMCTLPQGATNSVAHMQNAMHKVLREFVPDITIPFLDDVPMKGCSSDEKDDTLDASGCRRFVSDHIRDVGRILNRLEEVHLTLSGEKSQFGVPEILVVGHVCGAYGRKPNPVKVEAIARLIDCTSVTEVRRFLGSCIFYRLSIPHYAHVAEPLYALFKKGRKFTWGMEHHDAMEQLKQILQSPPVLRPLDYRCGRPIVVTVDTSPKAVGWAVGQDDEAGVRFAARFGAKILTNTQRDYSQVKRELWGARTALRTDRNLLIGAYVVLETDCLPLLGMIANCSTPDITMLSWIAFIRSLNPELRHIAGKKNVVADMLSRARYRDEEQMQRAAEEEEEQAEVWCQARGVSVSDVLPFREDLYSGKLRDIGLYLSSLERREQWSDAEFRGIRQKAYKFLLQDGYLWKRPVRIDGMLLRVVDDQEMKLQLLKEFHESLWAGHRGVWATYTKLKERYWWRGLYQDVVNFVSSCLHCQYYSKIRYRDGLVPTFPPSMHFQWVIDLVMMPPGMWGMKYLVLAREDLSNYVEGRALRSKAAEGICRFILEDIVCRYGSIGRMRADRGDLDTGEAREFFQRYGVKLKLTSAYNPEGIGKSERGHPPIVNALVKACDENEIPTWATLPWEDGLDREALLAVRIRQLERREEDIQEALKRLEATRLENKERFDKTHRLRPRPIQPGDWVLVYDSSLENQHSTVRKFSRRWFGPYVVLSVHDNATYALRELDGTPLRTQVAGKRVKLFRRREAGVSLADFLEPEEAEGQDFADEEEMSAGTDE